MPISPKTEPLYYDCNKKIQILFVLIFACGSSSPDRPFYSLTTSKPVVSELHINLQATDFEALTL